MSRAQAKPNAFLFLAATSHGGRRFGLRQAQGERALAESLRRERLVLMRTWVLPSWAAPDLKLRLKDFEALNGQLSQLLSRGVPLVEALEVTATVVHPSCRPIVVRMKELVAAGTSYGDACAQVGVFDTVSIAVYRAAERTGDLAGACKQLAISAKRQLAVSGKAATLLIYPAIVMTISIGVTVMMLTVIVPKVGNALVSGGIELPWFTKMLMALGTFLREQWLMILLVLLGVVAGMVFLRKQLGAVLMRAMRRTPLVKGVVLTQESARFFSVMAAMTRAGIPLADSLGVGVNAIGHPRLKSELATLRTKLIEGGLLRVLIERVESLPLATRRLLIAAERSGDLEQAFDGLAADLADEVDKQSSRTLAMLEPLLIVLMFALIGSLLLAIMIPLMNATSANL
ncbi:MAG: type II secretion system F family protein [Phycisphaeraceae bacterium]|nr:type II secretion system F family protein [Phycisphaeraceae bacterium]